MKARCRNVTQLSVAVALLLCAQSALGQSRPILPEVFQSPVAIQITTGTDVTTGRGKVIFDQPDGKARQFYRLQSGQRDEIITRYDLGAIFRYDRPTCDVTEVTGTMPLTWGWVQNAKQAESEVIGDTTVTF